MHTIWKGNLLFCCSSTATKLSTHHFSETINAGKTYTHENENAKKPSPIIDFFLYTICHLLNSKTWIFIFIFVCFIFFQSGNYSCFWLFINLLNSLTKRLVINNWSYFRIKSWQKFSKLFINQIHHVEVTINVPWNQLMPWWQSLESQKHEGTHKESWKERNKVI